MNDLERFWHDLIDGRRYIINEVYGNEAMLRYRPHPKEKEYFLANNGRVTYSIEVSEHTRSFWDMCERKYGHKRLAYEDRLTKNRIKAQNYSEYKKGKAEREALAAKIRGVILDHAKEKHQDGQQSQQTAAQETTSEKAADTRTTQKEG
jgi:uncharacterized protein YdaU (DUF1376 family)